MEEPQSFLQVLWTDIITRVIAFWIPVQIAPTHKKMVFLILLGSWSIFGIIFCSFEIAHKQSWTIAIPFFLQFVVLFALMRFIDFRND